MTYFEHQHDGSSTLPNFQCKSVQKIWHRPAGKYSAWHVHPQPVEHAQTTIPHTYMHALQFTEVLTTEDKNGKLVDWMPEIVEDPKE
eukprot:9167196-Ditylum_brightwellii.AAC.1